MRQGRACVPEREPGVRAHLFGEVSPGDGGTIPASAPATEGVRAMLSGYNQCPWDKPSDQALRRRAGCLYPVIGEYRRFHVQVRVPL